MNGNARSAEFLRFLAAGGLAAVSNVLSRVGFSQWAPLPIAVVLAYLVGMAVAFALMRTFVFPGGRSGVPRQLTVFALVNVAAVVQTLVITMALARVIFPALEVGEHGDLIAHIIGVGVPILTSFVGHKRWSFR